LLERKGSAKGLKEFIKEYITEEGEEIATEQIE
jgi:hypothetical protein